MSRNLTRRAFAKGLAALAAAPLAPAAADAKTTQQAPAPAAPPTVPAPAPQAAATDQDALALAQVVNNRWGDRLTTEELAQVIQNIDGGLQRAAELYRIPLLNADAPDFVFTPYRAGG